MPSISEMRDNKRRQYGTWTRGYSDISTMVTTCLEGMQHAGYDLPEDKYGRVEFKVSYIHRPCIGTEYMEEAFTAVKITYEGTSENPQSSGEEHERVQQTQDLP